MSNVVRLKLPDKRTPRETIEKALDAEGRDEIRDVLICGYDGEGDFFCFVSDTTYGDALWLTEDLREWIRQESTHRD